MESDGGQLHSVGEESTYMNAVAGRVRQALGLDSDWQEHEIGIDPDFEGEFVHGKTPNKRLLYLVAKYAEALAGPPSGGFITSKLDHYRGLLLDFFARENTTEGFMWAEFMSTTHGQLWDAGVFGLRLLALVYGDQELLEATGKHLRQYRYLMDLMAVEGHVITPNCRSILGGEQFVVLDLRDVIYGMLGARQTPGRVTVDVPTRSWMKDRRLATGPSFFEDAYNFGAWVLREQLLQGDDLGGAAGPTPRTEKPVLCGRLRVQRTADSMVACIEEVTGHASDLTWWAGWLDGKVVKSEATKGDIRDRDNPFPLPVDVGGWDEVIVNGVKS